MKRTIRVCPVSGGWIVQHSTPLQAFWWDMRHYGPGIAIHNALWRWVHRRDRWVRSG